MLAASRIDPRHACTACSTGHYKVPTDNPVAKFSFEREQLNVF
jgi:hypothetical protein